MVCSAVPLSLVLARVEALWALIEQPFEAWLSASEVQRLHGMAQPRRKQEFIASRYLLRRQLARHLYADADRWPELALDSVAGQPVRWPTTNAAQPAVHLGLSHSQGWLLAYAGPAALGIDLEVPPLRPRNTQRVLAAMGSPPECERFHALVQPEQEHYFYTLWTQKEAYLKFTGQGMHMGLLPQLSTWPTHQAHPLGVVHSRAYQDAQHGQSLLLSVFSRHTVDLAFEVDIVCHHLSEQTQAYYLNH